MALTEEQIAEVRRQVDQRMQDFEARQALNIADEVEKRDKVREETSLRRIQGWAAIAGVSGLALISGFSWWLTGSVQTTARTTAQEVLSEAELEAKLAAGVSKLQEEAIERLINASESVAEARQLATQAEMQAKRGELATQQAEQQGLDAVARIQQMETDVASFEKFAKRLRVARESEAQLQEIVEEIAADPLIQQRVGAAALPEGSVVAFDSEAGCPEGWSPYQEAAGKFLLGAGEGTLRWTGPHPRPDGVPPVVPLTPVELGDQGGGETHRLAIEELPNHSHNASFALSGYKLDWYGARRSHPVPTSAPSGGSEFDWSVGGNQPHNNMPPYIALYYCKRTLN